MKRTGQEQGMVGLALAGALLTMSAGSGVAADGSSYPSAYEDYHEITARDGMLIGGEGRTGDAMQYRGKQVWSGPGTATVLVRERENTGIVMGNVRVDGHTYTVIMDRFNGDRPFQSGGIAKSVSLHGTTRRGAPILPRTFSYLAGWGRPCTVWKDAEVLYDGFSCHFMLTETLRDPESGKIEDFPPKEDIRELLRGQRYQGDYERNRDIRNRIRKSRGADRSGLQLHLIVHSPNKDLSKLPPYEMAMHFMWHEVEWRGGPQRSATDRPDGSSREDRELERDIKSELAWSPFVDADRVGVSVRNGVAYLFGTVEDREEMQAAIENAFEAGADRVDNRLMIERSEDADWMG